MQAEAPHTGPGSQRLRDQQVQTPSRPITGTVYAEDGGPMTNGVVILSLGVGSYFPGFGAPVLDVEDLDTGRFSLEPLVPPAVYEAAEENAGMVLATLTVIGETDTVATTLNLRLVDTPDTAAPDPLAYLEVAQDPADGAPIALYVRPGAFGVFCTSRGEPRPTGDPNSGEPSGGSSGGGNSGEPTANGAQANHGRCEEQHRNHLHYRWTTAGEVHTAGDMNAKYTYAQQKHHDSGISTAFKPNGGSWQLGGLREMKHSTGWSHTLGQFNSHTAVLISAKVAWHHEGDIRYADGPKKGQSCGDSEQAWPKFLTAEFESSDHPDGTSRDNNCKQYDEGHRIRLGKGEVFVRDENHAHTFGNAGEFMGLGYYARSGFSDDVKIRWRTGSDYKGYYLCGKGPDGITNWTTVYAGPSVH